MHSFRLVKKSFVEESVKSGRFMKEEDHEWVGDVEMSGTHAFNRLDKERAVIDSGRRWRLRLNNFLLSSSAQAQENNGTC